MSAPDRSPRAAPRTEGASVTRTLSALLLLALCFVLFNVQPLAAWIVHSAPRWYAVALPFIRRLIEVFSWV